VEFFFACGSIWTFIGLMMILANETAFLLHLVVALFCRFSYYPWYLKLGAQCLNRVYTRRYSSFIVSIQTSVLLPRLSSAFILLREIWIIIYGIFANLRFFNCMNFYLGEMFVSKNYELLEYYRTRNFVIYVSSLA
jgi:hypothetical protein